MKKMIDAITHNIWLLALTLIAAAFFLTLLIGASFERVKSTSKGVTIAADGTVVNSDANTSSSNMDNFLEASGAFGDWEDFSSFYEETAPVPSKPAPSSKPESSSKPAPVESAVESSSSDAPPSAPPTIDIGGESSADSSVVTPESSVVSPDSSVVTPDDSAPAAGSSPMDAPSIPSEE